ncbi:Fungal specific transcription factor domain-containing protein 36 [Elsinoe fawcettii]|nr:Fungal specific transcription factor domain-containing protein 36 [Elsinoe fawcettii]
MLDLFDKDRHYAVEIPHLALHNVGLLKSVLAVAARHMVLHGVRIPDLPRDEASGSQQATRERHLATQFYHETLAYLSKAMAYPSYTGSVEILGTASMIGVYEMFDGSNRDWERHLKGTFWIQRCQNTNGESGGLRMAVWWAWLRQDIWAAFRDKRRTLTIWRPTKPLCALPPEELATRILYILAKVVQYASHEEASTTSIAARIEQGDQLLRSLQDWDQTLPSSFRPINYKTSQEPFAEQWIHPPSHAVAVQCYHCARIIMLLNQPSVGGIAAYSGRQSMLDESVDTICGIAKSHLSLGRMPLLTISFQCMFAAGLCVQPDRWAAFFKVFDETLELNKWPPKEATMELLERWGQSE